MQFHVLDWFAGWVLGATQPAAKHSTVSEVYRKLDRLLSALRL